MPIVTSQNRTSFASGEVSPSIRAANDLARFQTGAEIVENLIVMIEAILTRRPGTRFVLELKNEAQKGKMLPFRYSGSDYYVLGFNGGKMRVLKDGGFLESAPGIIYELTVPWLEADLPNLRSATAGNVMLQLADGKAPQKLTRNGHTDWTIAQFRPNNGPVDAQNLDISKTIQASAVSGDAVSLIGAGEPFLAGHIDGVFRLDEPSQAIVPLWQANETITIATETPPAPIGYLGDMTTPENAFDVEVPFVPTYATKAAATEAYVGRSYGSATSINSAAVKVGAPGVGDGGSVTIELYAKTGAAPTSATDGTLLAQLTYAVDDEGAAAHTLISLDSDSVWGHLWVHLAYDGSALDIEISDVAFSRATASVAPVLRRWQQNVYQALTSGNSGLNAPVHTEGDVAAGSGSVTWRYLHSGYGFVQITAVADTGHATGKVLSRLPESVVSTPTYRWSPAAWCNASGWPKQVATFDQRFYFARDNIYWLTKAATIDDFEVSVYDDSAIARRLISPDGSLVVIEWALSSGILVQGARDDEWMTRAAGAFDPITGGTVRDVPDTSEGSAPHIPALVDRGAIFIGRSRARIHYVQFDRLAEQLKVDEISVACRHIFGVGASALAWQRDPHRLLWVALTDGTLACFTFMPEEKIAAGTRQPMENCFVEDLVAIPTADSGRSQIYLQTRRTINGATRRYYEELQPFFEPADKAAPTAEGAWFVDCGLRYQGSPISRVLGADHLIGQTVAVFADGAEQTRKVVDAVGGVDLDYAASDVLIGIPIKWKFRDLPRDIQVAGGSSKGDPRRASCLIIDVLNSAGGTARFNESEPNAITETGAADYGAAIPLATGQMRMSLASATQDEGVIELEGDNALPFTLLALTPALEIEEGAANV